ncbi:hypothetical protein [Klebsiella phage KL01]|uniref:Uncharacterized protein n=2 Tax=root TaxID=1 RepID=A0AA96PXH7_9CAUD|nr:hypothetical protein [Klebsiella phage KL01]
MKELQNRFNEVDETINKLQAARAKVSPFSSEYWSISGRINEELDRLASINAAIEQHYGLRYTTGLPADLRIGL